MEIYTRFPQIATGYKKMAKWLVPLMQRFSLVKSAVWNFMVKPLSEHGYSIVYHCPQYKHRILRKFWFTIWNYLGK
jgi:hypothetical protein